MATLNITYTFAALTDAHAAEVNTNFTDVKNFVNTNVVHTDGSKVFTGVPSGPSTDPSSDNQFSRKAYVDKKAGSVRGVATKAAGTIQAAAATATWYTISGFSVTTDLVDAHYYLILVQIENLNCTLTGGPYPLGLHLRRAGTTIATTVGWFENGTSKGTAMQILIPYLQVGAASGQVFDVQVAHFGGGAGDLLIEAGFSGRLLVKDLGV